MKCAPRCRCGRHERLRGTAAEKSVVYARRMGLRPYTAAQISELDKKLRDERRKRS